MTKLDFHTSQELIPEEAETFKYCKTLHRKFILKIPKDYYPEQKVVENIVLDDKGKLKTDPKMEETIRYLEGNGNAAMAAALRAQNVSHKNKDRSFHYLPYHTDSGLSRLF